MSKLKELFEGSQYARLNTLPGGNKNFSVRNQSNTEQSIRQGNAVDFFPNTYQDGFDVNKPSLSVQGFAKAPETQTSDYTGNPTGQATILNNAFDSYNRFANDAFRNTYNSKLVHRFLATDSTKQYKTQQETSAGVVLTYNV
jgi:hypothetical protein